jgi:hypothetical protein
VWCDRCGVTGGKPIAVLLQPISGASAINPLVAFYDIYGAKREVLLFYFVPNTTRNNIINIGTKFSDLECLEVFFINILMSNSKGTNCLL